MDGWARHVVITRFNLRRRNGSEPGEPWLRERLDIFLRYTVPSLQGQTTKPDDWIILCSPSSPRWLLQDLREVKVPPTTVRVWIHEGDLSQSLMSRVQEFLGSDETHVITTRLDNDDALASNYVRRVQAEFTGQSRQYLNVPRGLQIKDGIAYRWRDPSNAFLSAIEDRRGAAGVYIGNHTHVWRQASFKQVPGDIGWAQVIHGSNRANTADGIPTVLRDFGTLFPGLPPLRKVPRGLLLAFQVRAVTGLALTVLREPSRIGHVVRATYGARSKRRPGHDAAARAASRSDVREAEPRLGGQGP